MIRQYAPTVSRFRNTETPRGVMQCGVLPIGTICKPQPSAAPVIIEAWLPRDYAKYERGQFSTVRIRGGHIAIVRCLKNGKRFQLSDAWLLDSEVTA